MLAGVAGLVLLVMAAVRFVGLLEESSQRTSAPTSFVAIRDESESISITIPVEWGDASSSGWIIDGREVGPAVTVASNVEAWYSNWGTPGAFIGVSTTGVVPERGDFSRVCTRGDTVERSMEVLSGTVQFWSDCGDGAADFYVFFGGSADGSYAVLVELVSIDGAGLSTLDRLLTTFSFTP